MKYSRAEMQCRVQVIWTNVGDNAVGVMKPNGQIAEMPEVAEKYICPNDQ